jgi:LysR family glycine cleavage system transcriptional activator
LHHSKTLTIRVAVTPSFAANWLMPRIGLFWDAQPDIEVELLPSMTLTDMRRDNIDVAIRYGKGGWTGVKSQRLVAAGHVAVAAASYLEGCDITCLGDLKRSRWLLDRARTEERFWMSTSGIELDDETVTTFPTGQLAREVARAGLGITVMPAPIAAPDIASGVFVTLCEEQNSPVAYHVLTRPDVVAPARNVFVK